MCIARATVQTLKPQKGGMYIEWGNVKRKRSEVQVFSELATPKCQHDLVPSI